MLALTHATRAHPPPLSDFVVQLCLGRRDVLAFAGAATTLRTARHRQLPARHLPVCAWVGRCITLVSTIEVEHSLRARAFEQPCSVTHTDRSEQHQYPKVKGQVCACVCVSARLYLRVYLRARACLCACMCMCACVCVCVFACARA